MDHTPQAHPASPTHSLPGSFANYRSRAQQHGPIGGKQEGRPQPPASGDSGSIPRPPVVQNPLYGAIGGYSGHELGSIKPKEGEYFDRSELPARFRKLEWTQREVDAIESGGAALWDK